MKTKDEIKSLAHSLIRRFVELLDPKYSASDTRKDLLHDIQLLQWVLDEPKVPCPNCTNNTFIGGYCPVCDDDKEVESLLAFRIEEQERSDLEKIKKEWGIS